VSLSLESSHYSGSEHCTVFDHSLQPLIGEQYQLKSVRIRVAVDCRNFFV
jgi:hypothetical protein